MSAIAEHRHLVDIMRPLAPAPAHVVCPQCHAETVHVGPSGRYCQAPLCEWEARPAPLPVHRCALPQCYVCGNECSPSHFCATHSRHAAGLQPMCDECQDDRADSFNGRR